MIFTGIFAFTSCFFKNFRSIWVMSLINLTSLFKLLVKELKKKKCSFPQKKNVSKSSRFELLEYIFILQLTRIMRETRRKCSKVVRDRWERILTNDPKQATWWVKHFISVLYQPYAPNTVGLPPASKDLVISVKNRWSEKKEKT